MVPMPAAPRGEPSPQQQALVARARAGDRDAFSALIQPYIPWLIRLTRYILGSSDQGDDAAQDALIRAYERFASYRGGSLRAWLRTIATRTAFNHSRARHTRTRYELQASQDPMSASDFDAFMAKDLVARVLAQLAYPYREILLLRHVEEMSIAEIAAVLELGTSATKMRLMRARNAFMETHSAAIQTGGSHADP